MRLSPQLDRPHKRSRPIWKVVETVNNVWSPHVHVEQRSTVTVSADPPQKVAKHGRIFQVPEDSAVPTEAAQAHTKAHSKHRSATSQTASSILTIPAHVGRHTTLGSWGNLTLGLAWVLIHRWMFIIAVGIHLPSHVLEREIGTRTGADLLDKHIASVPPLVSTCCSTWLSRKVDSVEADPIMISDNMSPPIGQSARSSKMIPRPRTGLPPTSTIG